MFKWDEKYQWVFSDLGAADMVGVNEAGIGIFKRQPYKGLAKEILQNVTDAKDEKLGDDIPAKAKFELIYVDRDEIPGFSRLDDVIHKCYEFYPNGDDGEKLLRYKEASERYFQNPGKVPVLKISDENTKGLLGVHEEKDSNWTGLVRERSATNKSNGASGSFGVGKFAPYNFSETRTVFYSTKTRDGEIAFQGKTILTTFKENGKKKNNIGLFANKDSENYDAVFDINDIAPVFRREKVGTDIYVIGFEKSDVEDWVDQTAISVIEYFFYSIYKGFLEVEICDGDKKVEINKENLDKKIKYYDDFCKENMGDDTSFSFTAPSYWKILNSDKRKYSKEIFRYDGKDMGAYELYLLAGDDVTDKKVLEMREAGMKIREDTSFRVQMNFNAIFIATGEGASSLEPDDNISSFLRKCENQAHDDWAADEYKEKKEKARGIINKVHAIILEAVKNEMPDYGDEAVDAFGLSEYLPNQEEDDDPKEEKAFKDFSPLSFEIRSVKSGKRRMDADISMKKNAGAEKRKKREKKEEEEEKDRKKKKTDNKKGNGLNKASEVSIKNIKTPFDSVSGNYTVSFIPEETANDVMMEIKIGSDDDNMTKAEISSASINGKTLSIKNGMIEVGDITKDEKIIVKVVLTDSSRKTMEVRAYAKCEN